jgi:hypothetical protein
MIAAKPVPLVMLAAALAIAGCNRSQEADVAKLDNQILANQTDPALSSALEDQILVDPALTQQSNRNAVRPATQPAQAQYPLPPGDRRAAIEPSSAGGNLGECAPHLEYSRDWVGRLPAPFAVVNGGRVTDAAGTDRPGCRSRVVTFTVAAPPQRVLDHYRGRAASAGYSAQLQARGGDQVLSGTAGEAAYYLITTPLSGGGTDVAMIVTG